MSWINFSQRQIANDKRLSRAQMQLCARSEKHVCKSWNQISANSTKSKYTQNAENEFAQAKFGKSCKIEKGGHIRESSLHPGQYG